MKTVNKLPQIYLMFSKFNSQNHSHIQINHNVTPCPILRIMTHNSTNLDIWHSGKIWKFVVFLFVGAPTFYFICIYVYCLYFIASESILQKSPSHTSINYNPTYMFNILCSEFIIRGASSFHVVKCMYLYVYFAVFLFIGVRYFMYIIHSFIFHCICIV